MDKFDWKMITVLFVVASASGGGATALRDSIIGDRHDPFTGTEAVLLEQRLHKALADTETRIRYDMPPELTRARILALEKEVEANHIGFEPPSQLFSERRYPR